VNFFLNAPCIKLNIAGIFNTYNGESETQVAKSTRFRSNQQLEGREKESRSTSSR
jgi:hypothetical protein